MKSNMFKRLVLVISSTFLVLTSVLALPATAHAQTWYNQNPFEWYVKVYDPDTSPANEIFGERYTAAQVQWIFWSLFSTAFNLPFTVLGMPPTPTISVAKFALGMVVISIPTTALQDFATTMSNMITPLLSLNNSKVNNNLALSPTRNSIWSKIFLEDRPISGIGYVRNISRKLTLVPEAKAQDSFGFSRLTIIQDLWKLSRNIAYFLFVLAIIIMSFMIMFKVKISPQVVISIQSALPKIIITLILVTFSYAIAGFLIDLMYVVMGIFSIFMSSSNLFITSARLNFLFIDGFNFGGLAILVYWLIFLAFYIVAVLLADLAAIGSLGTTASVWAFILGIFSIILFIIMIIDLFRITFALFKALAGFYFAVIIGPISLAMGVFPSSQNSFSNWIKSLVGKLAVFPATGILFYLSLIFLIKSAQASSIGFVGGNIVINALRPILDALGVGPLMPISATSLWGPPMLHNSASATGIAFILMGVSCIMIIPKVQKAIESALAGRAFDMESAVSERVKRPLGWAGQGLETYGKSLASTPATRVRGSIISTIAGLIQGASR